MEVLAFISFFFGMCWDFFTEIKVPGFDFTFASLFVGLFLAVLGLRLLGAMLGMSVNANTITGIMRGRERVDQERNDNQFRLF